MKNKGALLDVSLLIACAWDGHSKHEEANKWLDECKHFATCPIVQTGFLRVSMSAAHGVAYEKARLALGDILEMKTHRFVSDHIPVNLLPEHLDRRHDVTDAHLVAVARSHQLSLATLDDLLCNKPWAAGIAFNPFSEQR